MNNLQYLYLELPPPSLEKEIKKDSEEVRLIVIDILGDEKDQEKSNNSNRGVISLS